MHTPGTAGSQFMGCGGFLNQRSTGPHQCDKIPQRDGNEDIIINVVSARAGEDVIASAFRSLPNRLN